MFPSLCWLRACREMALIWQGNRRWGAPWRIVDRIERSAIFENDFWLHQAHCLQLGGNTRRIEPYFHPALGQVITGDCGKSMRWCFSRLRIHWSIHTCNWSTNTSKYSWSSISSGLQWSRRSYTEAIAFWTGSMAVHVHETWSHTTEHSWSSQSLEKELQQIICGVDCWRICYQS